MIYLLTIKQFNPYEICTTIIYYSSHHILFHRGVEFSSIGDQDLQQIKRDLPSRICVYSPTKFWGENLPMKSSETDIYIGSEELDYDLSTVYFNECYKYIQIPINQSGLLDSSIVRFNHIEVGNSPLSAPSKPKTFLIAQYPLDNDTVSPIFNIVTIIPQPKYMSDENIMALDFFNKVELKLNGVVLYSTLSGDFQRVDVLINGDMYFRGRLGNDGEYAENEIYTKLLFPSDVNIAQFGGGDEGGDGGDGDGGDDNGDGSDDPDWIDEAVVVADNPNNTGYIIDDPGINYPGPEIPGGGTNPPPVGGGGGNSFQMELIITVEGEGVVTGAGFYNKGENNLATDSAHRSFKERSDMNPFKVKSLHIFVSSINASLRSCATSLPYTKAETSKL